MKKISEFLSGKGEWFASGFFEDESLPPVLRIAKGIKKQLENVPIPPFKETFLFPSGKNFLWQTENNILTFHYSYSMNYHPEKIEEEINKSEGEEKKLWKELKRKLDKYFSYPLIFESKYTVGGRGWTHSIPNYEKVLKYGMLHYLEKIIERKEKDAEKKEFYEAMEEVIKGIKIFHARLMTEIEKAPASKKRESLIDAYITVPFSPAENFFQAIIATNLIFYLDGCDSMGRFDQILYPYYKKDKKAGKINKKEAVKIIKNFWENFDRNDGWNVVLGGSDENGNPSYNELTLICLEAAKKQRRPNLALRIRKDIPEKVLMKALEVIETGNGLPALYNEELYLEGLKETHLNIYRKDVYNYAFGGCTETMIHGKSNVGSLDGGINLVGVLSEVIEEKLPLCQNFNSFLQKYKNTLKCEIKNMVNQINSNQKYKAEFFPQPVRSLFIDDCLENGIEFNNGGAKYNWSVVNVAGLANTVDSLYSIKKIVYEEKYPPEKFTDALNKNYNGYEGLYNRIKKLPKYGNDVDEVDEIAKDISDFVFDEFAKYPCWRGGKFLPGCLMFVTYVGAGKSVKATPDGRKSGEAVADSIGPHQGRDKNGPTAMLKSVSKINHKKGIGSLVLNIRFSSELFKDGGSKRKIIDLIKTFFTLGGMQIQINVVDQEILKDAIKQPEKYNDLIVRVGGYSEYFNRLSYELKLTILERCEHSG